jgi:hypothetical protein
MTNNFSKLSTERLQGLASSDTTSADDKTAISEILAKRIIAKTDDSAAKDFGKADKKATAKKATPKKAADKKATAKKATPKKAADKKATAKKSDKKTVKVVKHIPRVRNELIGKMAKFTEHRTAFEVKGPIERVIKGTDGLPYIGVKNAEGIMRFKQQAQATIYGVKSDKK